MYYDYVICCPVNRRFPNTFKVARPARLVALEFRSNNKIISDFINSIERWRA